MNAAAELSTEARVGRILLLVSAIYSLVVGILLLVFPLALGAIMGTGAAAAFLALGGLFVLAVLGLAGSVVAFLAWSRAPMDPHKAGILGIVAAFLPPIGLFALVGGVLLLVSPEAKQAQGAGQRRHPGETLRT